MTDAILWTAVAIYAFINTSSKEKMNKKIEELEARIRELERKP